jgi:hypothetical protein
MILIIPEEHYEYIQTLPAYIELVLLAHLILVSTAEGCRVIKSKYIQYPANSTIEDSQAFALLSLTYRMSS